MKPEESGMVFRVCGDKPGLSYLPFGAHFCLGARLPVGRPGVFGLNVEFKPQEKSVVCPLGPIELNGRSTTLLGCFDPEPFSALCYFQVEYPETKTAAARVGKKEFRIHSRVAEQGLTLQKAWAAWLAELNVELTNGNVRRELLGTHIQLESPFAVAA